MLRPVTQAKEYFEKAAENDESGGHYNLGVMYLKGIGVKRDVKKACTHFIMAANAGQPKAFYQLAKMFHTGVGLKRNIPMVNSLDCILKHFHYAHVRGKGKRNWSFWLNVLAKKKFELIIRDHHILQIF